MSRVCWNGRVGAALLFSELEQTAVVESSQPFRPIYYLGCKIGFSDSIRQAINDIDPSRGRVLDLFAGTGVVAQALASERSVITVDIQEYSRVLCSAILNPQPLSQAVLTSITQRLENELVSGKGRWCFDPLIAYERSASVAAGNEDLSELIELLESPPLIAYLTGAVRPAESNFGAAVSETVSRLRHAGFELSADSLMARNFGGVYFSYEQSVALDAALKIAEVADDSLRDTLIAVALSTASTLVNTVGKQFAQPIQPRNPQGLVKPSLAKAVFRDRSLDSLRVYNEWLNKYAELRVQDSFNGSYRLDYLDGLERFAENCSVVYADPPYTRDHYSRFYHVLETMCLRDNPATSQVKRNGALALSRGVYRVDRHQSPFCVRSQAPAAFNALFARARRFELPVVLSYSPHEVGDGTHPRVVSMKQIVDLARKHYRVVEVTAVQGVSHNQLNRNGLKLRKREQAEVIVRCVC